MCEISGDGGLCGMWNIIIGFALSTHLMMAVAVACHNVYGGRVLLFRLTAGHRTVAAAQKGIGIQADFWTDISQIATSNHFSNDCSQ